jgi:hypothetical protein
LPPCRPQSLRSSGSASERASASPATAAGLERSSRARRAGHAAYGADYIEIQQLLHRYAFALDTCSNNGYDYADLFTPDGVFYWGVGGPEVGGPRAAGRGRGRWQRGLQKLQAGVAGRTRSRRTSP